MSTIATHASPRRLLIGSASVCVSIRAMDPVTVYGYGRHRTRDSAVNVLSWLL
jgi:hypothetical protein